MPADRNRLKPVWGRRRSDRNNTISVLCGGKEIAHAAPWQPLAAPSLATVAKKKKKSSSGLLRCRRARSRRATELLLPQREEGGGRGGWEIWEGTRAGGRGWLGVCESAAWSLHARTHTKHSIMYLSVCMFVCGWRGREWLRTMQTGTSSTQQIPGCNLTLHFGPLAAWGDPRRFFCFGFFSPSPSPSQGGVDGGLWVRSVVTVSPCRMEGRRDRRFV